MIRIKAGDGDLKIGLNFACHPYATMVHIYQPFKEAVHTNIALFTYVNE